MNRGLTDESEGAEKGLKAETMAQAQPEARNVCGQQRYWIATHAPRNLSQLDYEINTRSSRKRAGMRNDSF